MASTNPRRSGNPAVRAGTTRPGVGHEEAGALRASINARSRPVLARLARLPRIFIPTVVLLLMVLGLSASLPVALPAFAVLTAFVGWLAYLSWPTLDTGGRLVRVLMLAVVIGAAIAQVTGLL